MRIIIDFLRDLANNNNREWFEANRERYTTVKARMDDVAECFIRAISTFDSSVEGLRVKDCTYRIYRDTRFSKDKSPYKTWFGVYVCPRGKRSGLSGYYMHVEPASNCYMLCTGAYCPTAAEQRSVREEFMTEGEALVAAIHSADGFSLDWSDAYKRVPRGWSADDVYADYYRLRNYLVVKMVDETYFTSDDYFTRAAEDFRLTKPFNDILNRAIEYAREMGW